MVICIFILSASCRSQAGKNVQHLNKLNKTVSVPGYNLSAPENTWQLPSGLYEISGITLIDSSHLLAIEDLHPTLYVIKLGKQAEIEKQIAFAKTDKEKFDIEDVALAGTTAYALWSHGAIFKIQNWNTSPVVMTYTTRLTKAENPEGLCYDVATNSLLVACKNNSGDPASKKTDRAVYSFNLTSDTLDRNPALIIYKKDLEALSGNKEEFFPSAISIHPVTHEIYVLSSRGSKSLAVFSPEGKIKSLTYLDPNMFKQPEGICFGKDGSLFISSEGKHEQPAMLYKFTIK
ncbi:MAG: SdiA-regulated domain-containing protein [Ferruginibacter sp.]